MVGSPDVTARIDALERVLKALENSGPTWREYVGSRRDYVDVRFAAIERELHQLEKSTDERLQNAETTRSNGMDRVIKLIQDGIDRVETRTTDKFAELTRAGEKASETLHDRFVQIYTFRDQINSERLTYVTRDQLSAHSERLVAELDLVKRAVTLSAGKETGISRVWAGVVIAFSVLSALSAAVTAGSAIMRLAGH